MTKANGTKKALLMCGLSLLLCISMLIGTTYAWFTDSVTSANNIITSGNLDIGVYYATPADVVDGDIPADKWKPVTAESIFNPDALWEPGYTEALFFKFENEGSLALQYQFRVDILEETIGLTKDGDPIQLSNHINAYICNNFQWNYKQFLFTDRDSATNPAGAPNPYYDTLYNAATSGVNRADNYTENALSLDSWQWLEPTETTYATMVLWMPESVGNEVNHDGVNVPEINLGITVVATQYTYENDSFGNDYDKDIMFNVGSIDELKAAIASAKDGSVIYVEEGVYNLSSVINIANKDLTIEGIGNVKFVNVGKSHFFNVTQESNVVFRNIEFDGNIANNAYSRNGIFVRYNSTATLDNCLVYGAGHFSICIDQISDKTETEGKTAYVNLINGTKVESVDGIAFPTSGHAYDGICENSYIRVTADETSTIGSFTKNSTVAKQENITLNGVANVISSSAQLQDAIDNAADGEEIALVAGEYTVSGANNVVIVGMGKDTVIDIDGNIQNAEISNATITGKNSLNVQAGNTIVFENVVFDGNFGMTAQGVVNGDATFKGCTFKAGFHIDSSASSVNVEFIDCTFGEYGYIKLGGSANYSMTACTIEKLASGASGPWGKQWLIAYSNITLTDCRIGRVIRAGGAITITMNGCVDLDGVAVTSDIVHTFNSPTIVIN